MKLEKAIEILTIHTDAQMTITLTLRREAHQLGIEALKRVRNIRNTIMLSSNGLLPGETEE